MNFFSLALPCFAVSSLAADSSKRPKDRVDSLQVLAMNHLKPRLDVLPSFLVTSKSWSTEMAWAYSLGRNLGIERSMLTQTSTIDNKKFLLIHPAKVFEFLYGLGATLWNPNESSSDNTVEKKIFPLLFNMELLRNKLASLNKPQTLEEFRNLFAQCVVSTKGMITLDVAILDWLDQEIQSTLGIGNRPFNVEYSVLEPLCALSLYPDVEEYCTDKIMRVLGSIQNCSKAEKKNFFFPLLNIIKQLDPCPLRTASQELAAKIFRLIIGSRKHHDQILLQCKVRLGHGHEFFKLLDTFEFEDTSNQQIANIPEVLSLGDVGMNEFSSGGLFISFLNRQFLQSARILDKGKLMWEQPEITWTRHVKFGVKELSENSSSVEGNLESRLLITSHLELPATIWNEIKSCSNSDQLRTLMKPLCLTYRMTFLEESSVFTLKSY